MALVSSETARLKQHYHQTFEIKKSNQTVVRHTLLMNPQSLSQAEQARVNVTQTIGGAYIMDFGAGIPNVTISGTTGYKKRHNADGELRDGYQELKHLRTEVYRNFITATDPAYKMFWYNWEDEEFWVIQPTNFRLQRSVSEPTLYRYELSFYCIANAVAPATPTALSEQQLDMVMLTANLASRMSSISEILTAFRSAHKA